MGMPCSRCNIRETACSRCRLLSTHPNRWCQDCLSEVQSAFVVTLHFANDHEEDTIDLTCILASGAEVLQKSSLRPGEALAEIRAELVELLPTIIPGSVALPARDGTRYVKQAFEEYYGDRASTMWAEAVRYSVRLVFALPNGHFLEEHDDSVTTVGQAAASWAMSSSTAIGPV